MDNLSQLSIVVPTYNRQLFTIRQMEYWVGSSITLIVLDGSKEPISDEILSQYPENIVYKHLPTSLAERLGSAVKFITTPYVMLLADDEFYIPSAVAQCIEELQNDDDLVSCMGLAATFLYGPDRKILGRDIYKLLRGYKVEQDSAAERMTFHMNPYICSIVYSVMRANVWKKNIQLVTKKNYSTPVAAELQIELGGCFQGKSKVLNTLLWMRSSENAPISTNDWDREIDFIGWYLAPEFENERADFINKFAVHFAAKHNVNDLKNSLKAALEHHKNYLLTTGRGLNKSPSVSNTIVLTAKKIARRIFPSLFSYLGLIKAQRERLLFTDLGMMDYVDELSKTRGVFVDKEAVKKIVKIITGFRIKYPS